MKQTLENIVPFWDKLSEKERAEIVGATREEFFQKGYLINRTDTQCKGAMFLRKGQIRVFIISDDGREITLYRLSEGDFCVLSASCLLDSIVFEVIIEAVEDTEILLIPSNVLMHIKEKNPWVDAFLHKTATERFSDVMWTMQQILFLGADKRVAIFLWDEVIRNNTSVLWFTHEEIAKMIGSAREVVSKTLKYFSEEKILSLGRGKIEILDKDRLRKYLG